MPKLNLFTLPSQTTILFAGIFLVIGVPLLAGFTLRFQVLLPLLPVVVLILTVWDFLVEPDRLLAWWRAAPLPADGGWLVERVAELSHRVAAPPPLLRVTTAGREPFVIGTWRRRWLVIPAWFFEKWPDGPRDTEEDDDLDVVLLHELAHFANHDTWLTALARSLLKMTAAVTVVYWFMWAWQPILYAIGIAHLPMLREIYAPLLALFPPNVQAFMMAPPPMTPARAMTYWLELAMALAPLLIGALFLWRRDWNLLLRVREVYADARVATWLCDARSLENALNRFRAPALAPVQARFDLRFWRRWSSAAEMMFLRWALDLPLHGRWALTPQPEVETRRSVLREPETVYGTSRQIGVRGGVIVMLFYIVQASLLAPGQVGIGLELAIGAGFVVLALGLTPLMLVRLPDARAIRREIMTATIWFVLVMLAVLAPLLLLALVAVLMWPQGIDIVLYAIAGASPAAFAPVLDDPAGYIVQAVAGAFVAFVIAAPVVLWLTLWLDMRLKQRILTWYGAPWLARRSALIFSAVTLVLGVALWLGVLPLVSVLAFPLILGIETGTLVKLAMTGIMLLAAGAIFWRSDRRWHGRCPACSGGVAAPLHLDTGCPHCHAALAPWLLARY
ncbi:MAG: hypothetical protein M9936_02660 [Caldilinea sp.]|nr:hypothetical protein [Caldilinea sp.]MCB0065668.1 hypothetical protein [Caldilineaceae bacterium]MCB9140660.1 hypothetical protein [Anaerolineales bacterium]MCB9114749.1 hypothetical protein [Caldilineaceae bacterium]MCB9120389.1 hypothetical protein [Caldilineaceae bacterium]